MGVYILVIQTRGFDRYASNGDAKSSTLLKLNYLECRCYTSHNVTRYVHVSFSPKRGVAVMRLLITWVAVVTLVSVGVFFSRCSYLTP